MSDPEKRMKIALVGNPNVGKSTLFNALTGLKQHVGNWPGVTVEKKVGISSYRGRELEITDLPGMYSTTPYSIDEKVARDHLLEGGPDAIIHVVDATNLERNLYLTLQLVEMGLRPVIALSMMDLIRDQGTLIDTESLSRELGLPVVPINPAKQEGLGELLGKAVDSGKDADVVRIRYGKETQDDIARMEKELREGGAEGPTSWMALSLVSGDMTILDRVPASMRERIDGILSQMDTDRNELEVAEKRYALLGDIVGRVQKKKTRARTFSDRIDRVVTHKYLGIPIFLSIMWMMFELTFVMAEPFMELIDMGFALLAEYVSENVSGFLGSFIADGIISGVGSILIFLPNIMILFLLIAILEESGYLARAAFVMDRVMYAIGLQGKSIIPMLMGFGCNVPAIMATRTIDDEKDRLISILINPFMSCSARLPVYILLAGIFFPGSAGTVVFALYVLGILVGIASAKLFRTTLFKGEPSPFIMELPSYRMPSLRFSLQKMLDKGMIFVRKAGTIILLAVAILWVLSSLPVGVEYASEDSVIGMIGKVIAPIFAPLGFDWKIAVALIFGFIAKEVVIGALGTLYGAGEDAEGLEQQLIDDPNMNGVTAMGLMVFTLLYTPCVATLGVIRKEAGTKLMAFSVVYGLIVAWLVTFVVTVIGTALA